MFPLQTLAFTAFFRKCGEKSETAERNSIFGNKTAGRRSLKQGSGRQFSVFHRTFGIARRKYAANSRILEHTGWRAQTWCKSVLRSVAASPDITPS